MKTRENGKIPLRLWSIAAIAPVVFSGCSQYQRIGSAECLPNGGALARAQQAYWLENKKFAIAPSQLNTGISNTDSERGGELLHHPNSQLNTGISNTDSKCRYLLTSTKTAAFVRAIPRTATRSENVTHCFLNFCLPPRQVPTNSYVAGIFTSNTPQPDTFLVVHCHAPVGMVELPLPSLNNGVPTCPPNTKTLNR